MMCGRGEPWLSLVKERKGKFEGKNGYDWFPGGGRWQELFEVVLLYCARTCELLSVLPAGLAAW